MPTDRPAAPDASRGALDISPVMDWLVSGAVGSTAEKLLLSYGNELARAGVHVARIASFVRTLHPFIHGSRSIWVRGASKLDVAQIPFEITATPEYRKSPSGQVALTGRGYRWKLEGDHPLEYVALREQRAAGMTDYLALPLLFLNGEVHAITYSSDAPGGFTEEELGALRRVTPALARVAEVLALSRTAENLLDAYVGHNAGAKILAGRVRRGQTEMIHCVIWFSDLRSFTTLSATQDPIETIEILNRLFDCQVPAVERHGGEVLKFIGDGMLAIFRVAAPADTGPVIASALAAAKEAFAALDTWNADRAGQGDAPLRFGLALHVGDVAYGNIGGAGRLDFTCIGAAVNLASRVEGLTAKLGKRLLVTEDVARHASVGVRSLGAHELKGVAAAPVVYELDDDWSGLPSPL